MATKKTKLDSNDRKGCGCLIACVIAVVIVAYLFSGPSDPIKNYPSYGLLNQEKRSSDVCYTVDASKIVFGIILIETVFFPIYIFGYDLYSPERFKDSPADDCTWKPKRKP